MSLSNIQALDAHSLNSFTRQYILYRGILYVDLLIKCHFEKLGET